MPTTEPSALINSVDHLIEMLDSCSSYGQFVSVVKKVRLQASDLEQFYSWKQAHYTRNCAKRRESYELVVLCWEPGQDTPIHCHDKQDCWVYMVEGVITETHYQLEDGDMPVRKDERDLNKGGFAFINDKIALHTLKNNGTDRAVSLHLYASPISECKIYDEKLGFVRTKVLEYDTVNGIPTK